MNVARVKATTRESPEAKDKGKSKHNEKGKSAGKSKSSQETFRGTNAGKMAAEPRNKRTVSARQRKLVT